MKKVLVADDSAIIRTILKDFLTSEGYDVVLAKDGKEALDISSKEKLHAAILDINMPKVDGISVLKEFVRLGIPSIIFSSLTRESSHLFVEAIEIGAIDVVPKPKIIFDLNEVKEELLKKLKMATYCKVNVSIPKPSSCVKDGAIKGLHSSTASKVVAIAASTGGPSLVKYLLQNLPSNLGAAVMIVQHMLPIFVRAFVENLSKASRIPVKEGELGETVREDVAYVAPGDYHMVVSCDKKILLHKGEKVNFVRPSADVLFQSIAKSFGPSSLAIILSGIGCDGAKGALYIKNAGGKVIAQDESTAIVYGMPKAAMDARAVDEVLPISEMPKRIVEIVDSL